MENNKRFSGKPISDQILQYYKVNDVRKFQFSRPYRRKDSTSESGNEFASLWLERTTMTTTYPLPGILRWFPVGSTEVCHLSPLQNAIETMETSNKSLKDLVRAHHREKTLNLGPLSLKLNGKQYSCNLSVYISYIILFQGIVDPAVMGGIVNYEKAFFNSDYVEKHAEDDILIDKLKDLIAEQIPLLEFGIQVHKERAPPSLAPLQQKLEECFAQMKISIEEKYGKRVYKRYDSELDH